MRVINQSWTCNYFTSPLAVETDISLLRYKCDFDKNGESPSVYRIMVSSDFENNIGDMWDSKKVESDSSIQIPYEGKCLVSGYKYYWKVMVWDQVDVESSWSYYSFWRMGIKEDEWQGKWISIADIPVVL